MAPRWSQAITIIIPSASEIWRKPRRSAVVIWRIVNLRYAAMSNRRNIFQKRIASEEAMSEEKVPATRSLLHTVAKMHYLLDIAQVEIARRLELSPATVSRLLKRAREVGIVRIEVRDPAQAPDIAAALVERLALKQAMVVDVPAGAGRLAALALPVRELLASAGLTTRSVIGLGWGRTIWDIVQSGLPPLAGGTVVPCSGGLDEPAAEYQVNEMVRRAAEQTGGVPRFIHAPYLPSHELRASILADKAVRATIGLWDRLDVAVVGIGLPHRVDLAHGGTATTPHDPALLAAAGDVVQHYFDRRGRPLPWSGESRLLAVSADQLRSTPLVIAAAASVAKAQGILGAARAGLINALVTDLATAEAVLDLPVS